MRPCAILTLVLGTLAPACSEPERPPDAESQHVELYLDDGAEVCAGQLDAYDRFIERAFRVWTGEPPGDFTAAVHVVHEAPCGFGRSCAANGHAWLVQQSGDFHELAHLVVEAADGWSNVALSEGAAEALGPRGQYFQHVEGGPDVLARSRQSFGGADYMTMAVATRFFVEQYGIDAFRGYYRNLGELGEPAQGEVEQEYELAFGEPLEPAWSVLQDEQRCTYELWYCDEESIQPLPVEIDGLDCDDPQVAGYVAPNFDPLVPEPTLAPFAPQRVVQFEVEDDQRLQFHVEHMSVDLIRCGTCAERPPWLYFSNDDGSSTPIELEMQAGVYSLVLRQHGEGAARFTVSPVPE